MPEFVAKGHAWAIKWEAKGGKGDEVEAVESNTKWNLNLNTNLYEINQFKFGLATK